jgi:hypothetical protein
MCGEYSLKPQSLCIYDSTIEVGVLVIPPSSHVTLPFDHKYLLRVFSSPPVAEDYNRACGLGVLAGISLDNLHNMLKVRSRSRRLQSTVARDAKTRSYYESITGEM